MTDINFAFQNSPWIFGLLSILAISISLYYYKRTIPNVSKSKKIVLSTLRLLSLIILLLIIFEPTLTISRNELESPKSLIFIDNSASVNVESNNSEQIENVIDMLDELPADIFCFDSEVKTADSISFSGQYTDMSKIFEKSREIEQNHNISNIIIVSDGAFNKGINPQYAAENGNIPVISIGVGNPVQKTDLIAQSVLKNDFAYVNNDVPILCRFRAVEVSKDSVNVNLVVNNRKYASKKIAINPDITEHIAEFTYRDSIPGKKKVVVEIDTISNEISIENNKITEYIDLLDNKKTISIFAHSPSPDLSFLKQQIEKSKQYNIKEFIKKDGNSWYSVPNSKDIAETDVFVLIDFPSNIIDDRVIQQIGDELAKGKSVLYIAGKHISKSKLKNIESYLPFSIVSDSRNEYAANVLFNDNALSNTVFASYDYDIKEIADDLPPVFKTESFYKAKPDATSFSTFQVNNTVIDEPTILSKTNGKSRSWAFLVYGLYRWQLADFSSKQETQNTFYSNMISNVFKWLSISDRMERFVVNTNRNVYQNSEMIEINAQLYDEKYEPVDNASIEVVIQNSKFQKELTLKSLTNGRYLVNVEGIPVGDYSVKAEASLNNKSKLNASTSFTVEQLQLENRNYGLNKSLLEKLAQNSGGRYLHITEADSLLSIIKTNYPGQDKQISTTNEINLWNSVYLLSLVMILLSVEWFLRKRFGMI